MTVSAKTLRTAIKTIRSFLDKRPPNEKAYIDLRVGTGINRQCLETIGPERLEEVVSGAKAHLSALAVQRDLDAAKQHDDEDTTFGEAHVRTGTPDDVGNVMELARLGSDENGFVRPDAQKMYSEIWPALNRDFGIMGVIGEPGNKLEGCVLLRVCQLWYSNDWVLEERAVFVRPEFRLAKGARAKKLCEFSKKAAEDLGMPLMIGVLSNHRTEGKIRLYQRLFGPPAGAYWLFQGRTGTMAKAA